MSDSATGDAFILALVFLAMLGLLAQLTLLMETLFGSCGEAPRKTARCRVRGTALRRRWRRLFD